MKISSSAVGHNQSIPAKYTCDGENINPPLEFFGIPKEARSLVLIVDDPDAPKETFVHWILFNIPIIDKIMENSSAGIEGTNSDFKQGYIGPCPPSGVHRYFFKLYALDTMLDLKKGVKKYDLIKAMNGHIVAQAELIGLYKKS